MRVAFTSIVNDAGDLQSQLDLVYEMNKGNEFGTRDWGAAHVRLGEMTSLRVVTTIIMEILSERWGDAVPDTPEYNVMEYPCPDEYQEFLFDETQKSKYKIAL